MQKKGRPPGKNRTERVEIRLTKEGFQRLDRCAVKLNTTRTEVIEKGISLVEKELENRKD